MEVSWINSTWYVEAGLEGGTWRLVRKVDDGEWIYKFHFPFSIFQTGSPRLREVEAGIHAPRTTFYFSLPAS